MSKLLVLADKEGNIRGAFRPTLQEQPEAPTQFAMVPSEGQAIYEVAIPEEMGDIAAAALDAYYVLHEKGEPRLVKRSSKRTT